MAPAPIWKIALVLVAFALGWQVDGRISPARYAYGSQGTASFCQLSDAIQVAERAKMQGRKAGIQLLTNHQEVEAGEVITARLANFTNDVVRSASEFKIQRYDGARWQTDPSSPDGPWPRTAGKLKPGRARGCYRYPVPEAQSPGRYRFLTMIDKGAKRLPEAAEFFVRRNAG